MIKKNGMVATFAIFLLVLSWAGHLSAKEKQIIGTTEFLPNYIFHLFQIGDIWGRGETKYSKEYGKYVSKDDAGFLHANRSDIVWANRNHGDLAQLLFWFPIENRCETKKQLEICFDDLIKFYSEGNFTELNKKYPGTTIKGYEEILIKGKDKFIPMLKEFKKIYLGNYNAYKKNVWPKEEKKLNEASKKITEYFKDKNIFQKWEELAGFKHPADRYEAVLTSANCESGPAFNNLSSPDASVIRNDACYSDNFQYLVNFISHEMGIYVMKAAFVNDLNRNPEVINNAKKAGEPRMVLWRVGETLAEFYNEKIIGKKPETLKGNAADGKPYDFDIFYGAYNREYAKNPKIQAKQMFLAGLDEYVKVRSPKR
jgi:hypothetical protein